MDPRSPRSIYRVEISVESPLPRALDRLSHLCDLGVDWVRLSGLVPDHTAPGPVAGLGDFSARAHALGLGVLVDLGPAAVSAVESSSSPWWRDVLVHGQRSEYAAAFDVDWAIGKGKVLLPQNQQTPNYRRWRGDDSLVALRVEDPNVFEQTYAEVGRWFEQGLVDGVGVGDTDDLWNPPEFLRRLDDLAGGAVVLARPGAGPVGASPTTLVPELEWIVRDLPSVSSGFVSRVRRRLAGQATALGHPTEMVVAALSEALTRFQVSRSCLPAGREHLEAALAQAAVERPDVGPVIEALAPILADLEQPAARRFEVAAAAMRGRAGAVLTVNRSSGPTEQLLALTMTDVPEVEDLGVDTDGLVLAVCGAGLRLRRDRPDLFTSYTPVETFGDAAVRLVAFDRGGAVIVAVSDVAGVSVPGGWGTTEVALPAGHWWDHVTGRDLGSDGRVYVDELLDLAPVALLTRDDR